MFVIPETCERAYERAVLADILKKNICISSLRPVIFYIWSCLFPLPDMSVNLISFVHDTSPNDTISSNTFNHSDMDCFMSRSSSISYCTFLITNSVLLLPFYILVLCLGLRRWWQWRSSSTAALTSPSDSFTYHSIFMGLFGILGYLLVCSGTSQGHIDLTVRGFTVCSFFWYGETFFHTLTCLERYLAAVHPIIYLRIKRERGNKVGNISIGCIWLLCGGKHLMRLTVDKAMIVDLILVIISFTVVSFCSFSVLSVLIRPGPGDRGRQSADKSKLRAFYIIIAILIVLFLRLLWSFIVAFTFMQLWDVECVVILFGCWFNFPSSFVLPLLFLHRAGTLACSKNTNEDKS